MQVAFGWPNIRKCLYMCLLGATGLLWCGGVGNSSPQTPSDPVAAFLCYHANNDQATAYSCFSQRWQKFFTPELRAELATKPLLKVASASLVRHTDTTAVVRYSYDPEGKDPEESIWPI